MAEKKNYRWRDENFYARVGNKVANRINAYQEKYNALQSDYQKRNEGRKYTYEDAYVSDSADWANSVAQRRSELDAEVDSISAYIDRFKDGLDSNWVKQIKGGLADTKKYQGMMADAAVKDHEWWSNFENEEAYKYAGRVDGYTQKYSGLTNEELQNALANLDDGEERQWLQYNQGNIYGKNIRSQADFMQYSDAGSKLKYDDFDLKEQGALMKAGDEYLAAVAAVANHYGTENFSSKEYEEYTKIFNSLSEEEFQELAYCIAKDKENGLYYETDGGPVLKETSLTKQYLESKEKKLEYDRGVEIGNELKDKAVLADLYAAKMGLSNFSTGFKTFMGLDVGYAPGTTQVAGNTIRESFADDGFKLPDWMGGASARQAVFDLTSTTANQIPSIVVSSMLGTLNPVLGTASGISLMSGSAAGNAYMEAVDKGYGENEAKIYGAGIGILEGSLQYALGGIGKLGGTGSKITKAVSSINSGLARFALQWGGSMVSEGIEEGLQEVLDPILQNAILGKDENVDWGNVAYSALLGALSAGTLELGGTISKTRAQKALNNEIAKQYGGLAENIIREGLESGNGTVSERLAKQYKKHTEKGKSLTSSQVLSMLNANAQVRLSNLGESQNISKVAEAAIKLATGQELTNAEDKLLLKSQYGVKVAHDLKGDAQAYNLAKQIEGQADATYKPLEERVDNIYTTSESGKATIHDTNEDISLDNATVARIDADGMTLRVDGKEVSADEIDFADDSQSYLYSAVSKIENITPGAATAIIRGYDSSSGQTVGEYLNGIDEAYTYGYRGYSEADLKAGNFAPKLTGEQATTAYELGKYVKSVRSTNKADAIKKMRTALEAETEKAVAEGKETPKAKKMTITYNAGNGKVVSFDKAGFALKSKQKAAPALAKIFHEMGLGTNFEFYASYKKKGVRVYLDDYGVERNAPSGMYRKADGTIRIDLNAYSGKGLTLDVMAHELTHFIQQWSDEKYNALADFLIKTYEKTDMTMRKRVLREQDRLERIRGKKVSYNEAYDEVVANAMSKMLSDGNVMERLYELKAQDMDLAQKLWKKLKEFINDFLGISEKLFYDATDLEGMKEDFEQLKNLWAEAFVEASENFQANLMAIEVGVEPVAVEDITMYSYSSLAEAAGFTAVENKDGTRSFTRDGKKVSEVTVTDIDNSPIGAFINFSAEMGDISDADAMRQKQMFADICTMASKTNDFAMTMQFVGSAVFTGMKANADKQYGTTYDFPSICTKTQAVIDAMSAKMVKLGRGLNTNEIVQLYDDVFASGNPVPCPECYVFSRWIGIGGLLDNIKKYQDYYGDMEVKDVADAYLKMKAEVSKFADEQGISFGKAKGALTSKLTKEFNKLTEKIEKAQNQGEKVKPSDLKRMEELEPMMNTVKSMTWLENVYFADSSLKKVNPNFRVPNEVLFDLNNGEAFATQYKDAWAFRTTQGAGYGKAITPYAEARLGEGVLVTNNTTNAIKGKAQGSLDNYFLNQMGKLDKKSRDALKRARLKQKNQAFIGGQRFQSTSDARYENASDYLLAALEMQAMGGMVQCYTKVDGAVPAFSAWGFSINQSLMPLNGGLDADGNIKDTSVGGMKPSVAFENRNKYESAGTITIGVNDNHIRAMFKQWVRDFIIPYHASGGKADVVAEFRRIQEGKEAKGKAVRSTDYSRTQSDKVLSDEVLRWQGKTDAQIQRIHEIRDARIAILTGGKVNMTVVRSNRFLSALYDKLNGGEWDGVKLAKSKVESQIFPNEFWDQTVSYEESGKITKDYLEYCEDLGFLHRFSGMVPSNGKLVPVNGYNENGERVQLTDLAYQYDENGNKTDNVEDFFWKVLTDRRMYDNNGKYLAQKVVTLNDTTTETVTGFAKNNQGREYDKAKAEALAKKIVGEQYSSQETDADKDFDYSDLNWATDLGIITAKDRAIFERTINNEIFRGAEPQSANGEYIIDTGRCLMFTDGDFHRPTLSRVVEFVTEYESLTADAKEMITNEAKVTGDIQEAITTIEEMFGQGFVSLRNSPADTSYGRQVRGRKRINRSGTAQKARSLKESLAEEGLSHLLEDNGEVYSSQETDIDAIERAKEHFGTTTDFEEAGYILPSGEMLKFTDDNHRGERLYDHRAIGMVYGEDVDLSVNHGFNEQSGKHLVDFVENGGIRFDPGSMEFNFDAGMQLSKSLPITAAQEQTIRDFIEWKKQREEQYNADDDPLSLYRGPLAIHIDFGGNANTALFAKAKDLDAWGVKHLSYEGGQINADRIIADIRHYYRTGETRRPSVVAQFRYSEHDTDYSNRSLLANAFEGLAKSSIEYKLIQKYKGRIRILNEYEAKLDKVNAQIHKIRFTKGKYNAERLRILEAEAKNLANEINRNDRELLSLEASEPLRKLIASERKKEAQKTKEHVNEILQNKKVRAEQTELRHKIRKTVRDLDKILNHGNKKQNVKEDMKGFVSKALDLADYLFTDHISNDDLILRGIDPSLIRGEREARLVKETEEILFKLYDDADSITDKEFARLDDKRKANEEKLRDLLKAQRNKVQSTPVYNLFNDLVIEYASLKNSGQDAVKAAYNDKVEEHLRTFLGNEDSDRAKVLQNMRVADMTTEELWKLYNAYTMVLTTVRDANKFHVQGMNQTIEQVVSQISSDFSSRKIPEKKLAIAAQKIANKIGWDYEKLYYALDRIGSDAFTKLITNLADSENIVMQDVIEAIEFRDQIVEQYGFNNWAVNKEINREFLDNTGKKFKMTLGQLMSLYAYSRRAGAWDHIEYGGFVFGEAALTNPRPADSYKLTKNQVDAITSLLTKEQKGYVEAMQKFLSETMGAKGNEVSMKLYGIKMFGEKNYFPIHIAGQFKAQADESQAKAAAGFQSMSNAGFTNAQNPNAKAPFVLEGFNEIWSDHVNEMSRYHGTVPALEDIRRVMNRSTYMDAMTESQSIKQLMENQYGKEAVEYFNNLYREANSGAITDRMQKPLQKLLGFFRKNSVAYSLSVVIQQPSAMSRAYAMIDKKYFGFKGVGALTSGVAKAVSSKWNPAYANAYSEMKKYAPGVTMAKEIGGFDTHTGTSIRQYLLDTGKSLKQSMKTENLKGKGSAVLGLVDDNAIANLPSVADKIAWIEIWNACKRETLAKHKTLAPTSEEFMQIVGNRFTEVIRATQVYDSMFSKSPMLKSKSLAVQYIVSFMNEPNTTVNMVEKAVRDVTKGDWKSGVRTAVAVTSSIIFNNVLKSVIYAMRDDDEDETYIEKYAEAIASGLVSDFNPLSYIPYVRDVLSKVQGYDVERPDMAIVTDAIEAYQAIVKNINKDTENLTEHQIAELDKKVTDASWKLVGSLAAFFGIPVKNIYREIDGIIDHARIASANAGMTTLDSVWDKVTASIPLLGAETEKADKLYEAIVSGDKAYIDRLKSGYVDKDGNFDKSKYESAVRKALRENDPRIKEAAQANVDGDAEKRNRILKELKSDLGSEYRDFIVDAINAETSKIRNDSKPEKVTGQYEIRDFIDAVADGDSDTAKDVREDIIDTHIANDKTQTQAEQAFVSSFVSGIEEAYSYNELDKDEAKNLLVDYADMEAEDAADKITYWDFKTANPDSNLAESKVMKYLELAEPAGVSLDVYEQFVEETKDLKDIEDEWGDVDVSKQEQVIEVIDSLPLSWQQKDALFLAYGYSKDSLWKVTW